MTGVVNILALETATDACSVALLAADGISFRHRVAPREHSELLFTMIDEVLAERHLRREQIGAVAFGQGPGSFTGVRIAASVAQGFACARDLPLLPVSTLHALAAGALREAAARRVLVALDARRAEIYYAAYTFADAAARGVATIADCVIAPERLEPLPDDEWVRAGNGWQAYADRFAPSFARLPQLDFDLPDARDVVRLAAIDLAAGGGVPASAARPLYLRGAVD